MTTTGARDLESIVVAAAADKDSINSPDVRRAVEEAVAGMDRGELSLAEKVGWRVEGELVAPAGHRPVLPPLPDGGAHRRAARVPRPPPLKKDHAKRGVRVVPGGIARFGSYIEPGAVLMPSFVNIGAHVGRGTIVDTWATVGSGAWIGRDVHLSGGVGIGGVLEPVGARPVIVEDHAFLGSRCIVVEGVLVEEGAVLAANTTLTGSTHIIDVTKDPAVTYKAGSPRALS
jgi:2,3,4,5-tetrahydropyridine-2-carboxylate N-succinyltransferase